MVSPHPNPPHPGRELNKGEEEMAFESKIRPIYWEDGKSKMIDQTVIPYEYKYVEITTGDDMFNAIRT